MEKLGVEKRFTNQFIGAHRVRVTFLFAALFLVAACAWAQPVRDVVIDEDAMGPAGTDMNAILVFLQAPDVKVLGITVLTGDGWRNE